LAAALAGIADMPPATSRIGVGVDLSEKMLARAREATDDSGIEYRHSAIEDIDFPANEFDAVISSLALHYVEHFGHVVERFIIVLQMVAPSHFSVEHPVFTALAAQQWYLGPQGERLHWPVDDYQKEGPRHTQWMADDVIKYHRTVATYVNTLIQSGFSIVKLSEPEPPSEMLAEQPDMKDECRRPLFLLIAAAKSASQCGYPILTKSGWGF